MMLFYYNIFHFLILSSDNGGYKYRDDTDYKKKLFIEIKVADYMNPETLKMCKNRGIEPKKYITDIIIDRVHLNIAKK